MPSKLAVLTDFDGTITRTDVAEAILEEFAPASWWDIEDLHRSRKIGTRESMVRQFALLHAKQADLIRFVDEHVEVDETFRDFTVFCQKRKIPLRPAPDAKVESPDSPPDESRGLRGGEHPD